MFKAVQMCLTSYTFQGLFNCNCIIIIQSYDHLTLTWAHFLIELTVRLLLLVVKYLYSILATFTT